MKRNAAQQINRLALPACCAAFVFLAISPAFAQVTPAQTAALQQQQAQQQQAQQLQQVQQLQQYYAMQQYAQQQQAAQLGLNGNNNALAGVAGVNNQQIIGFNPNTGQPIYAGQTPPKVTRVMAEDLDENVLGTNSRPPARADLENVPKENTPIDGKKNGMPIDIRRDALREAAVSFGARGGLAWRTFQIRKELETRGDYMDKVYDFRQLLIPAPSGLLIEPPVISESINAMLIENDGQQAAVSDRIYNITNNAKIVSTARTWRNYLEREWGDIDPPPDILRPENAEERKIWIDLVRKGWEAGITQADDIFQDDLNTLQADFQGMIRFRVLLAQGMVSPPYALQVDRGVTGDGDEMRVGDRAVQITGKPELITGSESWQPASR